MEHGKQEIQPRFTLGTAWSRLSEDMSQRDTPQRPNGNNQRMESHQEAQTLGGKGSQDKGELSHYPSHTRTTEPERAYSDPFSLTRSKTTRFSSRFTPLRHQQIIDQKSLFFAIPGTLQEKKMLKREKQDFFQPEAERVRPHSVEAVGFSERNS
ncbi:hypothetical protein O181_011195 [Austropuccinia psidii MF-1]|uniref:Uncharacterized protein n=1 Tax=Austropuccinia psidii MF-1 TaxID=1389203 RepID=A0A9Q3BVF8_9BASI|nr:hypothetical protein [Austropuccinia psidii MF-1]